MVEYTKVNVKLSDAQIKKLKDAVKDNTGTTLRINSKMFNGNDLPHAFTTASALDAGIQKKITWIWNNSINNF